MDWIEIAKWAGGIIAAAVAGGLIFRFVSVKKTDSSSRTVTQMNNQAGRDIIGGDSVDKKR